MIITPKFLFLVWTKMSVFRFCIKIQGPNSPEYWQFTVKETSLRLSKMINLKNQGSVYIYSHNKPAFVLS